MCQFTTMLYYTLSLLTTVLYLATYIHSYLGIQNIYIMQYMHYNIKFIDMYVSALNHKHSVKGSKSSLENAGLFWSNYLMAIV